MTAMNNAKVPPAPRGLALHGRKFWKAACADFEFTSNAELELLRQAATAVDRIRVAEKLLTAEGLTVLDRFGQTQRHPAIAILDVAGKSFKAICRELGVVGTDRPEYDVAGRATRYHPAIRGAG